MLWQRPERIPVTVGILPRAWIKYRERLEALVAKHSDLFGEQSGRHDFDWVPATYAEGEHVDVWGCVWSNIAQGRESIVTGHPLKTREDIRKLKVPEEDAGFPHGFMFLRLTDLRGFEECMMDFAEEPPELQLMIDVVLEYNLRQAKNLLATLREPQIVYFGDDLGMQTALPISPEKWRKYLKPCFKAIYEPFKKAGHYVYMHTDGHIVEIIPDLIECGVDILNPQFRANGLDNLVAACKGKVCVDLDLDRQLFPFATREEIDAHVRESVEKLGSPEGGLMLKAEIDDQLTLETMDAIMDALEKHRDHFRNDGASSPAPAS